jgi:hypothetical protein
MKNSQGDSSNNTMKKLHVSAAYEPHERRRRSSRLAGAVLQALFSGAGAGPSFQMIFFPNGGSLVIHQHEQRAHHPFQFIFSMDELEPMSYEDALRLQERLGNVNRGASQEQINATTKTTLVQQDDIPKEKQCVVCLSEFQPGEQVRTLRCNHSFHKDCVDTWLHRNKTCPICKREIVDSPPAGPSSSRV